MSDLTTRIDDFSFQIMAEGSIACSHIYQHQVHRPVIQPAGLLPTGQRHLFPGSLRPYSGTLQLNLAALELG